MAKRFTDAQETAITVRNAAVIVSAGAGSGKTSVLVERVMRRVLGAEQADVERLLLVTFTEAAAAEMKERIAAAIRKYIVDHPRDAHANRQLHNIDRASISTLHGFCLQIIRSDVLSIPVDPGFRIIDDREQGMLRASVMDAFLEDEFAGGVESFLSFVDRYAGEQGEEGLRELIERTVAMAQSQIDPQGWLMEAASMQRRDGEGRLSHATFGDALFRAVGDEIAYAQDCLARADALCELDDMMAPYAQVLHEERRWLHEVALALEGRNFESARGMLQTGFVRLPVVRDVDVTLKTQITHWRDKAKQRVKQLLASVCGRTEEVLLNELRHTAEDGLELARLCGQYMHRYAEAKRARGVIDFDDLEHFAYLVLTDADGHASEAAHQLSMRFDEIMVDEYQDTSPIQDAILRRVARDGGRNLFQVGDVKQSIYGFRMAEPALFLDKYDSYADDPAQGSLRIDLQDNFRSRKSVVDAVNFLFGQLFSRDFGGLVYDERARMQASAEYPLPDEGLPALRGPVEVHLIQTEGVANDASPEAYVEDEDEESEEENVAPGHEDREDLLAIEQQARVIGHRIQQLFAAGTQVFRPDEGRYTKIRAEDIAILLRSRARRIDPLLRVLRQMGIACQGESDSGYYTQLEMRWALALFSTLDNPLQDIALAAVLRSPIFSFRTAELARIRLTRRGPLYMALREAGLATDAWGARCREVIERIETFRSLVRTRSVRDSVATILDGSGLLMACVGLPDGAIRVSNLEELIRTADAYDQTFGGGLSGFIAYLESHRERVGDAGSTAAGGAQVHGVRVMTIHKSKGLEFPVVFVADINKEFRGPDTDRRIVAHRTLGFAPEMVDLTARIRYATVRSWTLQAAERRHAWAEEARILYVAMTRARELLIVVGSARNLTARYNEWREMRTSDGALGSSLLIQAHSVLDWLGPAMYRTSVHGTPLFAVQLWNVEDGPAIPGAHPAAEHVPWDDVARLVPSALPTPDEDFDAGRFLKEIEQSRALRQAAQNVAIPAKVSATEWKRMTEAHRTPDAADSDAELPMIPRRSRDISWTRPRFVQGDAATMQPAEAGTVFHRVMECIALSPALATPEGVERGLSSLIASGQLTATQAAVLSVERLVRFFQSPVGARMIAPQSKVMREVPFTMAIAPDRLFPGRASRTEDREVVVMQGAIDCVIVEPCGLTLLDYKTDRVTGDLSQWAKKYDAQLTVYREALQRAWKRPVIEAFLYFVQVHAFVARAERDMVFGGDDILWKQPRENL